MVDRKGAPRSLEWQKTIEGDRQGVVGGVEFLRGTDTLVVEEFPWGYETSGVTLEGKDVPGVEKQGQGGNRNYPATRDTQGSGITSRGEEMVTGQNLTVLQRPNREMA